MAFCAIARALVEVSKRTRCQTPVSAKVDRSLSIPEGVGDDPEIGAEEDRENEEKAYSREQVGSTSRSGSRTQRKRRIANPEFNQADR